MSEQVAEQLFLGGMVAEGSSREHQLDDELDTNDRILRELRSINDQLGAVVTELTTTRKAESRKLKRWVGAAVAVIGLAAVSAVGVISYGADRANNTIEQAEEAIQSISTEQLARDFAEDIARYGRIATCHEMKGFQKILPKDIKETCGFIKEKKKPATTASLTEGER